MFLDFLCIKREELAQARVQINEKDYYSTNIKSLPFHLSNFASKQLTATHLFSLTKTIDPDLLISIISEEYSCNQCRCETGHHPCTFNGKGRDHDKVMAVIPSHSACQGNLNPKLSKKGPECWNCGESRHICCNCKKPKKKSLTVHPESMNQVVDNSDDDAFNVSDIESDDNSMPGLESAYDSDGEVENEDDKAAKDWFSDVSGDWDILCGMGY